MEGDGRLAEPEAPEGNPPLDMALLRHHLDLPIVVDEELIQKVLGVSS